MRSGERGTGKLNRLQGLLVFQEISEGGVRMGAGGGATEVAEEAGIGNPHRPSWNPEFTH